MKNKKKILHISKYYPPYIGGVETVARDFAIALKNNAQCEQMVFCFNDGKNDSPDDAVDGIKVYRVGSAAKISSQAINLAYYEKLANAFASFKPDIVVFHYPNPFVSHCMLKVFRRMNYWGKFILYWHEDIIKQKLLRNFFIRQNYALLNRADAVIATSPAYLKDTDYLPKYKDKVIVMPLSIGDERLAKNDHILEKETEIRNKYKGKRIVFFFGRHVPYKGLNYLIDADKYLNRSEVQIVIAGKGPMTEELTKRAKPYSNIDFVGRLGDDDLNAYLRACYLFAFPSITRNEAFGISLAEAMHFGKPACTFTIIGSGVNWVCPNDVAGLEAPNKDVKAYADNINRLLNDEELYDRLSKGATDRCGELFMKDSFDKNVIEVYKRIAAVEETSEHLHEQISKNHEETENKDS